jgi:hypothetical protein
MEFKVREFVYVKNGFKGDIEIMKRDEKEEFG